MSPPAMGGPLGDALAGAEPAATQQLQQLAAPATASASGPPRAGALMPRS